MEPSSLTASVSTSLSSQSLMSLSQSRAAVGSTWMVSSMLLTTYYSTAFLKYRDDLTNSDFQRRHLVASIKTNSHTKIKQRGMNTVERSTLLNSYTRPQLLTIFRLSGSFLLGIFARTNFSKCLERFRQSLSVMRDFAFPAIFMFFANYCNVIALDRLGISLTYTSKCGIPILTVLITILVDGFDAIPSFRTLCTLIPIAIGIAMASWNSPTFDLSGFISALISATSQASLNVSCKRALTRTKINGLQAQTTMAALAFCFAMVTTSIETLKKSIETRKTNLKESQNVKNDDSSVQKIPPLPLTIGAVVSYHIEYVLSFLFLSLVKPITYGTCDAVRRLGIIICGRQMFGGEAFSLINYTGIGLALIGALLYSLSSSFTKI